MSDLQSKNLKFMLQCLLLGIVIYISLLVLDMGYNDMQMSLDDRSNWEGRNNARIAQSLKMNSENDEPTGSDKQLNMTIGFVGNINLTTRHTTESPRKLNMATITTTTQITETFKIVNITTVIPEEKLMTSWTNGRLGNNMGIHAISLGLAKINGYKPVMHRNVTSVLGEYFDLQTPTMDEETENKQWTNKHPTDYMQEEYRHWNETYIRVLVYLNSWTFYHHIRSTIRKEFTFKKDLQDEAQRILHQIVDKIQRNATFVGVHVRRGDYVKKMPELHKGVLADKHYMDEAASIFRNRYKDAVFVVVSDDTQWCKENINSPLGDVFIANDLGKSSPGQDMATLVACNHTIMTFGTYGFWASYLCGGDVIYLANYTLPNSTYPDVQKHSAFFLPEWHGIAADLSPLLNPTSEQTSAPTI